MWVKRLTVNHIFCRDAKFCVFFCAEKDAKFCVSTFFFAPKLECPLFFNSRFVLVTMQNNTCKNETITLES